MWRDGENVWVLLASDPIEVGRVESGDVLLAAADHCLHAVDDHLLCRRGYGHQSGGALAVYRLTRDLLAETGRKCREPAQVHACGACR